MRVFQFSEHILLGGHFPKWIFAEGRSTRSPWCLEKIQGPIWRSKDHLVMKGLSKNVKNHEFLLVFHYSVRQKIGDPGSISTQNMFPLSSVTPKRPELPYGAKYFFFAENPVFWFLPLLISYWSPIDPYLPLFEHVDFLQSVLWRPVLWNMFVFVFVFVNGVREHLNVNIVRGSPKYETNKHTTWKCADEQTIEIDLVELRRNAFTLNS